MSIVPFNPELKFPFTTYYTGRPLDVVGNFNDFKKGEHEDGKGYVADNCIWEYTDNVLEEDELGIGDYPVIGFNEEGEVVTRLSLMGKTVPLRKAINKRLSVICENTPEDADYSKDVSTIPHASSIGIYVPEILEEDDFLKKLIKTVFLIKQVSTAKYRKKMNKTYAFSNLFQGLNSSTKISTIVWQTWIEILGIDCMIILKDSGTDNEDPIGNYVVYKSRNDTITTVDKDKISEFLSENL